MREGAREGWREGGREGGTEGGRERGRERERVTKGEREKTFFSPLFTSFPRAENNDIKIEKFF